MKILGKRRNNEKHDNDYSLKRIKSTNPILTGHKQCDLKKYAQNKKRKRKCRIDVQLMTNS
jgi:hypothetical protein